MKLTTKSRFTVTAMTNIALHGSQKPVPLARISER
jgi:DNA-binding IscR family transcriptional regulator